MRLKQGLLSATEKTCGWTKKGIWRKQTWWWNEKLRKDITEKRRLWMLWKADGRKDKYLDAKWKAEHAVHAAKRNAEKEKSVSVLKTIKKLSFVSPNKCVQKIRM